MARFLFVVPPLTGHVNPTVSVAHHLKERGHDVAWVGFPAKIRPLLPGDANLIGLDDRIYADMEAGFREESLRVRGLESLVFLWKRYLIPLARAMTGGVADSIDGYRPDVLVVDQQALAGALEARRRSLPWATFATSAAGALPNPTASMPKVWEFVLEQMAGLQRDAGLEPVERPDNSPTRVVVFSTRELMGDGDYPASHRFVGPSISARHQDVPFPWECLRGDQRKVLISLGTVNPERGARFFRAAIEALGGASVQVILVAPPGVCTEPPPNFVVRDFVPQVRLMRELDAVVCHAGQNTVSEALAHGLPLVVAPIKDDQPVIASQVVQAGAGIRLKFGRLRPGDLREAVEAILHQPAYREAARRIQFSFREAGGAGRAADFLEELL